MTVKTLFASLFLFVCLGLNGQFSDSFSPANDLSKSAWKGDLNHFMINPSGQLQLNAPEAGLSRIFRQTNLPDSVEWNIYFKMDFSPSNNNKLRIYLQLDTVDLTSASGYFIEIGENGVEDKIKFARMINGTALVLAEGTSGYFSDEPSEAFLRVRRNAQGLWKIYVRKPEDPFYEIDFELFDSTVKRYFDQIFMVECTYTSTRREQFYFDDISVSETVPDKSPPKLLEGKLISNTSVELVFDEILDKPTVVNPGHYIVSPFDFHPVEIAFNPFRPNRLTLHFANEFIGNTVYLLSVMGLCDLSGNTIIEPIRFSFYLSEDPAYQDLLINEILFDPYPEGEDFIELYNHSEKILKLKGLVIKNNKSTAAPQIIKQDFDLFPGKYVAISPDTLTIRHLYLVPDSAQWMINTLPSLNNDQGNVSIYLQAESSLTLIDSVNYHEDMHFQLISNSEGVSLERIFWDEPGMNPDNWQSGAAVFGNATPGYRNSQSRKRGIPEESIFNAVPPIFSPDQDGFNDILVVNYRLPEDGWVGTIDVFTVSGQHIRTLVNNKLLGTDGFVTWDGLSEDGSLLPVSPYIILARLFHPTGKTFKEKMVCLLAEQL
jgi:hypothetical protein